MIENDDELLNISQLTLQMKQPQKRRSSVLRRMSIGVSQNSVQIPLSEHPIEENPVFEEAVEDEEHVDEVLYRRSDSTTKVQAQDFDKLCVLGQGAYGKVFLVKSKKDGRLFAQKELKKASVILTKKSIERTISERTILSQITKHQNIVKLFYAIHDESKLYLLMEFIPGGELFQYLAKEKFLNEKKSAFYIAQMSMALRYLHSCGIIYRDLKPENCMLDKDGYLILTDFGLAKQSVQSLDNEGNWCKSIIGTPEYCAPEVLNGEEYGFKSDWWSLGCVMFDLLTGDPPFIGNSHLQILKKVKKEKPKFPTHVMPDSRQLMNKLLEKNVEKRLDIDKDWIKFQSMGFFSKYYKFKDIEKRIIEPPIKPKIGDLQKAECFDDEFTNMKLMSSIDIPQEFNNSEAGEDIEAFNGFSFRASGSYFDSYGGGGDNNME